MIIGPKLREISSHSETVQCRKKNVRVTSDLQKSMQTQGIECDKYPNTLYSVVAGLVWGFSDAINFNRFNRLTDWLPHSHYIQHRSTQPVVRTTTSTGTTGPANGPLGPSDFCANQWQFSWCPAKVLLVRVRPRSFFCPLARAQNHPKPHTQAVRDYWDAMVVPIIYLISIRFWCAINERWSKLGIWYMDVYGPSWAIQPSSSFYLMV